jgi:hypothetical protein
MKKAREKTKDASQTAGLQAVLPLLGVLATVKNEIVDLRFGNAHRYARQKHITQTLEQCDKVFAIL